MIPLERKGFTLIELIVCLGIMGIVSVMISVILLSGLRINSDVNTRTNVQSDIRSAEVDISDDIRKGVEFINTNDFNNSTAFQGDTPINFLNVFSPYIPVICIKNVNGNMCLYAVKHVDSFYQLYKFNLEYSNSLINYAYDSNTETIVDPYQVKYFYDNFNIPNINVAGLNGFDSPPYQSVGYSGTTSAAVTIYGWNDTPSTTIIHDLPMNFFFYQGQDVFRCVYYYDSSNPNKSSFRSIKLKKLERTIQIPDLSHHQLIISDLTDVPTITLQNDGKSYDLSITASGVSYNTNYSKTINTSISLENYGGNGND